MQLQVVLILCFLLSTLSFRSNNLVFMGASKKTALQARKRQVVKTAPVHNWTPPVSGRDESRVTKFDRKVYDACCHIPKGMVTTYKEIARVCGAPHAHRAVGSSLRRNPYAPEVPCHRVVSASGVLAGFMGSTDPKGKELIKKRHMLMEEGVKFDFKGGVELGVGIYRSLDETDTSKARVNAAHMFVFDKAARVE